MAKRIFLLVAAIICLDGLFIVSIAYSSNLADAQTTNDSAVYFVTNNALSIVDKGVTTLPTLVLTTSSPEPKGIEFSDKLIAGIQNALSKADDAFFATNKTLKHSKVQEVELHIDAAVKGEADAKVFIVGGSLASGIKVKMVSK